MYHFLCCRCNSWYQCQTQPYKDRFLHTNIWSLSSFSWRGLLVKFTQHCESKNCATLLCRSKQILKTVEILAVRGQNIICKSLKTCFEKSCGGAKINTQQDYEKVNVEQFAVGHTLCTTEQHIWIHFCWWCHNFSLQLTKQGTEDGWGWGSCKHSHQRRPPDPTLIAMCSTARILTWMCRIKNHPSSSLLCIQQKSMEIRGQTVRLGFTLFPNLKGPLASGVCNMQTQASLF